MRPIIGWKIFTHDFRSPIQEAAPLWNGQEEHWLPKVMLDESTRECGAGHMMNHNIIEELRGELTRKQFMTLTGISLSQLWKIKHQGHSLPPRKIKILCELARQCRKSLSQYEILSLLLGGKVGPLADLDLLLKGRNPLDTWLKTGSQRSQAKILGLDYSTIFHRREGKFQRFWPAHAIEIARRSNYQIDLFDLLGWRGVDN